MALLAVAAGLAAAGGEIAFRAMIALVERAGFDAGAGGLWAAAANAPIWLLLAVPTLGGLVFGCFAQAFLPNGQPVGVAQAIEAATARGGRMALKPGLLGALANAWALGCGASGGREGPIVHLGATIGASLAKPFRLDRAMTRTLLGCGVAAAVAAGFNAPIAGALFAAEVVLGHYALSAFAPVVLAAVTAPIVSRAWYGDHPAFVIPADHDQIQSVLEFPAFALLGVAAALCAILLVLGVEAVRHRGERFAGLPRWARPGRPALAGLIVGLVAIQWPQVLGVGYEATDAALAGVFTFPDLVAIGLAKILCVCVCLGLGFGTGVFSPALFLGAFLGCAFGVVAGGLAPPEYASPMSAYGVVGMAAVAGAVLGAPISTILIVFEMTGDYGLTLAVMTGTVIATLGLQLVLGRSFFHRQLKAQGLDLALGAEASFVTGRVVVEVMQAPAPTAPAKLPAHAARARLTYEASGALFVVDDDGRLMGQIALHDLAGFDDPSDPHFKDASAQTAGDVAHRPGAVFDLRTPLKRAAELCQSSHESVMPVVYAPDDRRLAGYVWSVDVVRAYVQALEACRREERGEPV